MSDDLYEKAILKIEELTDELREAEAYIADQEREILDITQQLFILARMRDEPDYEGPDA